jgi:hypothetical protein
VRGDNTGVIIEFEPCRRSEAMAKLVGERRKNGEIGEMEIKGGRSNSHS